MLFCYFLFYFMAEYYMQGRPHYAVFFMVWQKQCIRCYTAWFLQKCRIWSPFNIICGFRQRLELPVSCLRTPLINRNDRYRPRRFPLKENTREWKKKLRFFLKEEPGRKHLFSFIPVIPMAISRSADKNTALYEFGAVPLRKIYTGYNSIWLVINYILYIWSLLRQPFSDPACKNIYGNGRKNLSNADIYILFLSSP